MSHDETLAAYLNDHLAGETAALELARRVADTHAGTDRGPELARLAADVEADRDELLDVMARLDVTPSMVKTAAGWLGEKAGRLKPNGHIVTRSPLADILELEGLRLAVAAKLMSWQVLRAVSVHDSRLAKEHLETLLERADDQAERLYRLHLQFTQEHLT